MFEIPKERLLDSLYKNSFNYKIAEYYQTLYMITDDDNYMRNCERVANCYKYFSIDMYLKHNITDITSISLCNDKFCKNCQNVLSKQRYLKFKPYLDALSEEYDLYHVTLTVPNVSGLFLNDTLDKMYDSFGKFIKIFRRKNSRHKYLNLESLGYVGAVRSLELTYNEASGYHPHFHCIFALKKELDLERCIVNKFSYSNGIFNRSFTTFEQTIQKLWYLIYNNKRITEDNFLNAEGYSCTADITNYDYKEVFKYTLKETFDDIVNSEVVFLTVRRALHYRRIIQGYGKLFGISDYEGEVISLAYDNAYEEYIEELKKDCDPIHAVIFDYMLRDEIEKNPSMNYISRATVKPIVYEKGEHYEEE